MPDAALAAAAVARTWGRDRMALDACGARHAALADHARRMQAAAEPAQ